MDSLLITAMAAKKFDELAAVFFNYGQKTLKKEKECFLKICDHYQIKNRKVIDLEELGKIGGSSLTDANIEVGVELDKKEIPLSYVPFRNTIFLSYAVSWAEVFKAQSIYIGAVLEDATGYPDCRPEYYEAFNHLISKGASHQVKVEAPIVFLSKQQIIKQCLELQAPLEYTWSCYQSVDKPCMKCDSCLLRKKAFDELSLHDPLLA